jgi:two-component system, OmpR family, phosphate regulon response regulator PhoB
MLLAMSDMRPLILSAEDDPDIRELLRLVLEHGGYRLVAARDGEDALAVAEHETPALFLLDSSMPRLSGIEVSRALRAEERFRDVPIVLLTATRSDAREVEAAEAGVTRYVLKPVVPNDLLRILDDVLGTSR